MFNYECDNLLFVNGCDNKRSYYCKNFDYSTEDSSCLECMKTISNSKDLSFKDFANGIFSIHCPKEEDADRLFNFMHSKGINKWFDDDDITDTLYGVFGNSTYYTCDNPENGNIAFDSINNIILGENLVVFSPDLIERWENE